MIRASSVIALLLTLCHAAWCFSALSGPIISFILNRRDGDATGIMATRNVLSTYPTKNKNNNNNNLAHPRSRRLHPRIRCPCRRCENIPTWISLSGDLAFSHQDGIYGFKFPKRFSELSQAKTSLYSLYLLY